MPISLMFCCLIALKEPKIATSATDQSEFQLNSPVAKAAQTMYTSLEVNIVRTFVAVDDRNAETTFGAWV